MNPATVSSAGPNGLDAVRAMARVASQQVERVRNVDPTGAASSSQYSTALHLVRNPYSGRSLPVQHINARVDGPRDRPYRRLLVVMHSSYQLLAARLTAGWAVVSHRAGHTPRLLLHRTLDDLGTGAGHLPPL